MFDRIIGVFKLDREVFAEIEHDTTATSQAAIVVAIVAALSVVGSVLGTLFTLVTGGELQIGALLINIVTNFLLTFVNWLIWSAVTLKSLSALLSRITGLPSAILTMSG